MIENLVHLILNKGGRIKPLLVPYELAHGTGQMNPSILIDDGRILVNIRNVGYVLIHSENEQRFCSRWGPLTYTHPENDQTLRTTNIFMELDDDLNPVRMAKVDTSKLDVPPLWEFIGLEDARLVRWKGKLYMTGVRRDTTPNGVGRMELSEIEIFENEVKEVSRLRIESTNPGAYCEKNWMPILDMPFHYVKWSNPTEVIRVNLDEKKAETVIQSANLLPGLRDFRGSSQILPYKDGHMALVHEVDLFNNELGQKDAYYYHRLIVWDSDWNIIQMTDDFHFMTERMGFSCGMAILGDKVLLPFGHQDNSAYILEIPINLIDELLWKTC
jgi:hypothetical protein